MATIVKKLPVLGMTLSSVKPCEVYKGRIYALVFETEDGRTFVMDHEQSCCELVFLEDVCGEFSDLVGSPLLQAESVSQDIELDGEVSRLWNTESCSWTFYKFATRKGSVTLRWLGTSNGCYSEEVRFVELESLVHYTPYDVIDCEMVRYGFSEASDEGA